MNTTDVKFSQHSQVTLTCTLKSYCLKKGNVIYDVCEPKHAQTGIMLFIVNAKS